MKTAHKGHFLRHYVEMVVAMFVGMAVLGAAGAGVEALTGVEYPASPEFAALKMAFDMSVGMVVWMRYRGHGWAPTMEMVGAMFAPALALAPLSWLGVISGELLMIITHVAMLPLMLLVMLRRRAEYTGAATHTTATSTQRAP
jgi:flagellar biosynthetic protein FliP